MPRPKGTKKNGLKFLDRDQIKSFEKALEEGKNLRDEVAMRMCFRFGLRVQELANLRVQDINFDSQQLSVEGLKSGRTRTYDIDAPLWKKIVKYLRQDKIKDRLFPLSTQGLKFIFKRYAEKAGLPSDYSIHSLRHSIGIAMAQKGASAIYIMKWLRHRSVSSSQVYFEQLEDKKLDGVMNEKVFPEFM
ncbi:MAG: tyrosine-type recombinase/integrase [Candidatus Aminicenantaceae bacterium]